MNASASSADGEPAGSGKVDTPLQLAQSAGPEIYVDEHGRQILLDAFTTGVLGVRGTDLQQPRPDQARTVERYPLPARDGPASPKRGNTDPEKLRPHVVSAEPVDRKLLDDVAKLLADVPPTGKGGSLEPDIGPIKGAEIAELQILLDRKGASPGVIDGHLGSNVDKALTAYREITGQDLQLADKEAIDRALSETGGDAFVGYTITPEDAAGPFIASVPADYGSKAKLDRLSFTSVSEMLAERFHMDERYLKAINPEAVFGRPGAVIKVANTGANVSAPVHHLVADKTAKQLRAYDSSGRLIAAYPATIGSSDTPSPSGSHEIVRVVTNPGYTYNPGVNFKQGENNEILSIPPGPNGPVGAVWIGLSKPSYGIHGTPDPSKIGKTASHGCVRLTNWDALELAKLVKKGVTVRFAE